MSDGRPQGDLAPPLPRSADYAPAPMNGLVPAPAPAEVAPAWPLRSHLELAAFPSAVSWARGHVRWVAREWGLSHLADTAELLASELVTNGIRASARLRSTVPVVRIQIVSDRASIVIQVWDGSDEMPVRKEVTLDDEGGRGLVLVESLGQDWGAYRQQNGKVVWVVIGMRNI